MEDFMEGIGMIVGAAVGGFIGVIAALVLWAFGLSTGWIIGSIVGFAVLGSIVFSAS